MDVVALVRFLLVGIALLLAFLAVITWSRRKDAPGAGTFSILIGCMAIYALGYSGEVAQTTVANARFWLDIEYLVLPWTPGFWLLAACQYTHRKVRIPLLFIIPSISFVDHYFNFYNSFYNAPFTIRQNGPFYVLEMGRGPVSMLDNAYLLVAFLAGAWIYLSGLRNASSLFRKQALVLLLSSLLPVAGYFFYLMGLSPWGLDITPITLGISSCLFYYGYFHCGLYNLAPVARALIFNSIRDAVLILDMHGRLLDFNPAASALLPMLDKRVVGSDTATLLRNYPELVQTLQGNEKSRELVMGTANLPVYCEVRTWPLTTDNRQVGRALIVSDVTAQVRLREELRSRAETDFLTGVANRRRFLQAIEVECIRFSRNHTPLSLLMIDLDHFKQVNDECGHPAGDVVLSTVAQRLLGCLRKTDLLARFGGEEFAVMLPETRIEGAMIIAERIRATVAQYPIKVDERHIFISVSVGVATHEGDWDADPKVLIKEADLALYRAKAAGRNRIEVL
ncbi:histidine kinase N-terminal 7TM domain-containing diguanylate cyclase [Acidicapsa ligni]|uniref:histidine kinase N-terminal 7TM domain-containing diguanylate cyclase n=1 Tax=Acidicapsa ligni TaxID=542300 RepID=UPI0021DFC1F4|nr:diguanylate cyclase [Acidicapsa ligni]